VEKLGEEKEIKEMNLKQMSDSELIKLRDSVSDEIILRNCCKTSDGMFGINLKKAAQYLSFDFFSYEQCLKIAENLLATIEKKKGEKNNGKI